jgi:hypothetical protein
MPFIDAKEQLILNHLFRNTSLALPATNFFIGLFTTAPNEAGASGVEVSTSGTAYARQAIARTGAGFNAASGTAPASVVNTAAVNFAQATAAWGTVTHWGIFETVSGADLWFWALLHVAGTPAPKVVGSGDTASFGAGVLKVTAGKEGDDLTP